MNYSRMTLKVLKSNKMVFDRMHTLDPNDVSRSIMLQVEELQTGSVRSLDQIRYTFRFLLV